MMKMAMQPEGRVLVREVAGSVTCKFRFVFAILQKFTKFREIRLPNFFSFFPFSIFKHTAEAVRTFLSYMNPFSRIHRGEKGSTRCDKVSPIIESGCQVELSSFLFYIIHCCSIHLVLKLLSFH